MKKLILIFFSLIFCSVLHASTIKEIVVFGDSLTDNGRLYSTLKFIPKSPPYFKGRFSNGFTWAELVGKAFYDRFYIDTQIYAWGGATAILHNPAHDSFIAPIVLETELYDYFLHSLLVDKSKILYIIWIGANDYLYERDLDINGLTNTVVDKVSWAVETLISHGAKNFMLMTLPDLSKTPFAQHSENTQRLEQLAKMHNQKLLDRAKYLSSRYPTVKITTLDIFTVFNDLLGDVEKYNQLYGTHITNTKEACWKGSILSPKTLENVLQNDLNAFRLKYHLNSYQFDQSGFQGYILNSPALKTVYGVTKAAENGFMPCENADQYVFWDDLHPTAVLHSILAKIVEDKLLNENIST